MRLVILISCAPQFFKACKTALEAPPDPITTAFLPNRFHPAFVLVSIAALNPKLSVLYPTVVPSVRKTIVFTAPISRAVSSILSRIERHASLCGIVKFTPAKPRLLHASIDSVKSPGEISSGI